MKIKLRIPNHRKPTAVGLVFWADQGTLVVSYSRTASLRAYLVERDGTLKYGEGYYALYKEPGEEITTAVGMTVDTAGRLYAATREGVQIFDPTGRLCGVLSRPADGAMWSVAFGGKNRDILHVSCGGTIYARKTKAMGVKPPR
jgi:sugar lactone lactonase YvrE